MTELAFGLRDLPPDVSCAWGARWIWPDDLVWDRQDTAGGSEIERERLHHWLNGHALTAARERARDLSDGWQLSPREDRTVTLFEDELGTIVANPQRSFGYLYVAAWLK